MLDRSDRLGKDEAAIRALVSDRWGWLVSSADLLRNLLRVKVEDGNDLQMAATTVELLHARGADRTRPTPIPGDAPRAHACAALSQTAAALCACCAGTSSSRGWCATRSRRARSSTPSTSGSSRSEPPFVLGIVGY